jgi:hypothetical protein
VGLRGFAGNWRPAAATVVVLAIAGCGSASARFPGPRAPASPSAAPSAANAAVRFKACDRGTADPASTNLRARNSSSGPAGRVTIEHAADLRLGDGTLGAGNGYEAASASGEVLKVAEPGRVVPVTLSVLNSPTSGRRVGFVEVRLSDKTPVRWKEVRNLVIVTDGGDGGFFSGDAPPAEPGLTGGPGDYVKAFFPNRDSASGNVCVLRTPEGSTSVDAVLFETGYGDGSYPTFAGLALDGSMVSIVSYGSVMSWPSSGLPGTPPQR